MRCVFCKAESAGSHSVEHIIPEALGNVEHILPRGVVCDTCNNYFARKVEGPLLQTPWFKNLRSRQWINNKRGRVPPMDGLVPAARLPANVWINGGNLSLCGRNEIEDRQLTKAILSGQAQSVCIPIIDVIDERILARFLAKVAMEILAHRLIGIDGWEEQLVDNPQLDPLRRFARIGDAPHAWPFSRRRIYEEDHSQTKPAGHFQILHEFTILYTERCELYAVVCIFGEEFAVNFGGPEISGYEKWLAQHEGRSPLYLTDTLPVPVSIF